MAQLRNKLDAEDIEDIDVYKKLSNMLSESLSINNNDSNSNIDNKSFSFLDESLNKNEVYFDSLQLSPIKLPKNNGSLFLELNMNERDEFAEQIKTNTVTLGMYNSIILF